MTNQQPSARGQVSSTGAVSAHTPYSPSFLAHHPAATPAVLLYRSPYCLPAKLPAAVRKAHVADTLAMNGTQSARHGRPAPAGPTPPAPAAAPPVPPNASHAQPAPRTTNGTTTNGTHAPAPKGKKKPADQPVDPSQMYETLKNRIAALEEEEVHEEEEERRFGEWHRSMRPRRWQRTCGRGAHADRCGLFSGGGSEVRVGHDRDGDPCKVY